MEKWILITRILCILLVYIHIVGWCTVHTMLKSYSKNYYGIEWIFSNIDTHTHTYHTIYHKDKFQINSSNSPAWENCTTIKTSVRPSKNVREIMIFACLMWLSEHSFILLQNLLEIICPQVIVLIYVSAITLTESQYLINNNYYGRINSSSSRESSQFWVCFFEGVWR